MEIAHTYSTRLTAEDAASILWDLISKAEADLGYHVPGAEFGYYENPRDFFKEFSKMANFAYCR